MGKSRMMGAGNASATLYKCSPNLSTGGGNKKQGITSRVGLNNWENREVQTQSNGIGRFKLFFMNQLGGVETGHSMFGGRWNRGDGLQISLYPQHLQEKIKIDKQNNIYSSNNEYNVRSVRSVRMVKSSKTTTCTTLSLYNPPSTQYSTSKCGGGPYFFYVEYKVCDNVKNVISANGGLNLTYLEIDGINVGIEPIAYCDPAGTTGTVIRASWRTTDYNEGIIKVFRNDVPFTSNTKLKMTVNGFNLTRNY